MVSNNLIKNRTQFYLGRTTSLYPKSFMTYFETIKPQAVGFYCDDVLWRKHNKETKPILFFVVNVKNLNSVFMGFLKSTRKSSWYVDDYVLELGTKHVFCFKVLPQFYNAFEKFMQSKYSQMYTDSQLKDLGIKKIVNGKENQLYSILKKTPFGLTVFEGTLQKRFYPDPKDKVHLPEQIEEYDLPFVKSKEILNYDSTKRSFGSN
jgi:hypothetical protein